MLDNYLNQTVLWLQKTGESDNGAALYARSAEITVRFEYARKMVRKADGDEAVSEAYLLTAAPVSPGDRFTHDGQDWTALTVRRYAGLGGAEVYREARL